MSQGWENNIFSEWKREKNEASSKWWNGKKKQSPKSINVWNNKNKKEKNHKIGSCIVCCVMLTDFVFSENILSIFQFILFEWINKLRVYIFYIYEKEETQKQPSIYVANV